MSNPGKSRSGPSIINKKEQDFPNLEIKGLMNVFIRRKDVGHDHKVDFASSRQFHTMKAVDPVYEGLRVQNKMLFKGSQHQLELSSSRVPAFKSHLVIFREDSSKQLMLRMVDCFDDKSVIGGEIEETPTFPRRA